ncbi:hypothetical protein PRK78_002685 [Emydomyces testavorans]|uniref:Uncharacterized protein n=1 Tax=Emydomyces testavorans TaxID=2070801 RepID=A0AAF0IHS9_9EURO|nr:hypothetical protein PRK78_002685 [Emydomyces testavorans]
MWSRQTSATPSLSSKRRRERWRSATDRRVGASARRSDIDGKGSARDRILLVGLGAAGDVERVELRGIVAIGVEERRDRDVDVFLLWVAMSCDLLPVVTGMVGMLGFGLSLRDASLVIVFSNLLCTIFSGISLDPGPENWSSAVDTSTLYFWLNLATVSAFTIIDCVIGGQTLSAVNSNDVSVNVGIVIVAMLALCISFFGYKVLHQYERYGWIPILVSIIIASGCGGKHFSKQAHPPPASASAVLSFGGLIAGFLIPWAALSTDFCTYILPDVSSRRVFSYVYLSLFIPNRAAHYPRNRNRRNSPQRPRLGQNL